MSLKTQPAADPRCLRTTVVSKQRVMRRFSRIARACISTALTWLGAGNLHAAPPSGAGWTLAWNDEFTGSTMDTTKWRHWLAGARRDAINSPSSVSVAGGNLTISTYTSAGVHYTGMISTQDTFPYTYGYIEARINFDSNPGMWSAFWMQSPTMGNPIGSPNAAGTEIDICEHRKVDGSSVNREGNIGGVIHWDGYGADHKSVGYDSGNLGLGSGFHVYGMEWTPTQQKFYIDGTLRWTVNNNAASSPVSQRSEFIILSSEVDQTGTTWAGPIPAGGYGTLATTTTKMDVDYVRVYQRAETVVNGDFEGRLAPFGATNQGSWSATGGRSDPAAGKIAPTTTAGASVQQTVRGLMPATDYVLTGWGDPGTVSPRLDLGVKNHGGTQVSQSLTTAGFAKATVPFTTGETNRTASAFASGPNSGSTGYADDFLLRRAATVNNGQLEDGNAGAWNTVYGGAFVSSDGTNYGGDYAWKIPASGSSAGVEQEVVGLSPSTTYRLTGWTNNGGSALTFGVKNHGGTQVTSGVAASAWTRGSVNFTTGASSTSATVFAFRGSSAQTAYADSFFLSQPLVAPWASQDVTAIPLSGTAGTLGDKFVMQACGAEIGGTSDKMHFIYQTVTGDVMITARLLGVDASSLAARTGVMIRESNSSFVRSAALLWSPSQTLEFVRRTASSGSSTKDTVTDVSTPPWLRLIRRGNVFTAYSSPDGAAWSRIGTPQTIAMSSSINVGIPSCSGDAAILTESALDNVSVVAPAPDVLITSPVEGTTFSNNGQSLGLTAVVTDSGTPAITWSEVSGPGVVTFENGSQATTSATFSAPGAYVLRCAATNAAGTGSDDVTVNVATAAAADPAWTLRLKLDESTGTTASDSSGFGNNASASGGLTWLPSGGMLTGAADFNGTDSYLTVPDNASLDPSTAFTVSYWFNANVLNGSGLVSKRNNFNDNNAWSMFLTADGRLNVDVDSNNDRFTSSAVFNRGAWYHIALVFDGSQAAASRVKLYVNGVLDTTADETSATIPNYNSPINIGILNSGTTAFFDGMIDEVRLHRRALSAAEVLAVRNETDTYAPVVSTGAAPAVTVGTAANLSGSVTADAGAAPTAAWTRTSGPGSVAFGNAASSATTVTFDQPGAQLLRLTGTNANARTFAELSLNPTYPLPVLVITNPPGGVYLANALHSLRLTATLNVNGMPGIPVVSWSKLSGPGTVSFVDAASLDTGASFSANGNYVLRCTVTNTAGTVTADTSVAVGTPPSITLRQGDDGYSHLAALLRNDVTTWNSGARDQLLIGRSSSGNLFRSVFSFGLTGVPAGAVITGASLDVWTDAVVGVGTVGAFELRELSGTPVEGTGTSSDAANINGNGTGVTWNSRTGLTTTGNLWTNPGGDYGSTVLSGISGFTATATGVRKTFATSAAFTAAAQSALGNNRPLNLMLLSPTTESGSNNNFARLSSDDSASAAQRPALTISWAPNPAPSVDPGTPPAAVAGTAAALAGSVSGAVSNQWSVLSGPGAVVFGNASQPATTATFAQPGAYVLKLASSNSSGEVFRTIAVSVSAPLDPARFVDWQSLTWPGVTDPGIIGSTADPDGDGISNLLEWALELSASQPDSIRAAVAKTDTTFDFTYTRRKTAAGEAIFLIEWSDTLGNDWSGAGVGPETLVSQTATNETIRQTLPANPAGRRFVRIRVVRP